MDEDDLNLPTSAVPSTEETIAPGLELQPSLIEMLECLDEYPFTQRAEEDQIAELARWTLSSAIFMTLARFLELSSDLFLITSDILLVSLYSAMRSSVQIAWLECAHCRQPQSSSSSVVDDESPEPAEGPSDSSDEDDADDNVIFVGHI